MRPGFGFVYMAFGLGCWCWTRWGQVVNQSTLVAFVALGPEAKAGTDWMAQGRGQLFPEILVSPADVCDGQRE